MVAAVLSGTEPLCVYAMVSSRVCPTAVSHFYGKVTIVEVTVWFLGVIHRIVILQDLLVGLLTQPKISMEMQGTLKRS